MIPREAGEYLNKFTDLLTVVWVSRNSNLEIVEQVSKTGKRADKASRSEYGGNFDTEPES